MSEAVAYPPERHILRDLRIEVEQSDDAAGVARMPQPPLAAGSAATPALGAIGVLVDVLGGGMAARAASPDWIATADLTLHRLPAARPVELLEARGRVVRKGRTTVVLAVDTVDDAEVRGTATMTFAVLPRRAGNLVLEDVLDEYRASFALPQSGLSLPLHDAIELVVVDAGPGVVEMPVSDYVVNSMAGVQGGVVVMLVEAAAAAAAGEALGAPTVALDVQLTYLAQNKVGPVVTRSRVLGAADGHATVSVELVDTGADGRTTAHATVVCAVEPGAGGRLS